jgi:hypothetical protein
MASNARAARETAVAVNFDAFFARLNSVRRSGNGWVARCPAHEDRSPSLSIGRGRDGRTLLHCFAGCSIEDICAALRIRVGDLFMGPPPKPQPPILRAAQRVASEGLRHHRRAVREEPITVIFTDATAIDAAIARALALTVEGELCQVALKES